MLLNNTILLFAILIWMVSLFIFSKKKMNFSKFIIGVVGGFVFSIFFGKIYLNEILTLLNLIVMDFITKGSSNIHVFMNSNAVSIFSNNDTLSYFITYECSGLIEMLVFTNVLLFYPIFRKQFYYKVFLILLGNIYIFAANIVRMLFMSYIVVFFGINSFYVAHVILARLLFVVLNILLYYVTLTLPHIKEQKADDYTIIQH